jgi:hypothetical protein
MLTPWWLSRLTKEVRSSRGGPAAADAGCGADAFEHFPDVGRVERGAVVGGEDQPGVVPVVPGRELLTGLAAGPGV